MIVFCPPTVEHATFCDGKAPAEPEPVRRSCPCGAPVGTGYSDGTTTPITIPEEVDRVSQRLNASFAAKPDGMLDFLAGYPMDVDPQTFGLLPSDMKFNPMTNMTTPIPRKVGEKFKRPGVDVVKEDVLHDKSVPLYCDFEYLTDTTRKAQDIINPGGTYAPVAAKSLVVPVLHESNHGGHFVKMYFLPWKEDKKHNMILMDDADYFMTASMHGCRFRVEDQGGGWVRVSHTNVQPRQDPGFDPQAECLTLANKGRRVGPVTVDYGKDVYIQEVNTEFARLRHHAFAYGLAPEDIVSFDPESYKVNVFGRRVSRQWEFYYQIKGKMIAKLAGHTTKKKHLKIFGHKTGITYGRKTVEVEQRLELDVVVKTGKL
jgi:hypothetical protein